MANLILFPSSSLNALRSAIYCYCGVAAYSSGYRPRKLRKVCREAVGLDLRRKEHVLALAQRLGLVPNLETTQEAA